MSPADIAAISRKHRLARSIDTASASILSAPTCSKAAEPRLVWELFCSPNAIKTWNQALSPLSADSVRIGYDAVFVHQKPYVEFDKKWCQRCELADVVVVVSHWSRIGSPVHAELEARCGLLLQAKVDGWPPVMSHPQFKLYSRWPEFRFKSSTFRRRHHPPSREFEGGAPHERAQYLCLSRTPAAAVVAMADVGKRSISTLGETVERMICGLLPTRIDAVPRPSPPASHWSRTVWDLVEFIAHADAPRWQVGMTGTRGSGTDLLAALSWDPFFCLDPIYVTSHGEIEVRRKPPTAAEPPQRPGTAFVQIDVLRRNMPALEG